MNKQWIGMVTMVVFLYIIMTISSAVERSVSVKIGCHYSPEFAAKIQELNNWRAELRKNDPLTAAREGSMILFGRYGARALIAVLATAFTFGITKWGAAQRNKKADEKQRA
jgi:hypothetical protein